MIDYLTHIAGLNLLTAELNAPAVAAKDGHLTHLRHALANKPSYAALGSIIDHLFEHFRDCDHELDLLSEASQIWQDLSSYLADVALVRKGLEDLVLNPNQPDALTKYNALADKLQTELKPKFLSLVAKFQAFFAEIKQLKHVTQHGQAHDQPVKDWPWRDIFLSRRTAAFLQELTTAASADGSPEALAFAYGAIASYAGNVVGSTYLNQCVRGPRRSHPIRDRVCSYTVGAWIRQQHANLTPSIGELKNLITFGAPTHPNLPANVEKLLLKALDATYGAQLGPKPKLRNAYKNLLRHLELLQGFSLPPAPQPINSTLWGKISMNIDYADPSGGAAPPAGQQQPSSGSSSSDIPWWAWVLFAVCVAAVAVCFLIGLCGAPTKDPYRGPFQNDGTGQAALTSYLGSNDALISVNAMFNLHVAAYEMAVYGLKVMKLLGMLYAEPADLPQVQFSQFTAVPSAAFLALKRPAGNADLFLSVPTSADEHPVANITPFPAGATPSAFLAGGAGTPSISSYGLQLWLLETHGSADSDLRRVNRNLDADRGFHHECWALKPGASIANDPELVDILGYNAI